MKKFIHFFSILRASASPSLLRRVRVEWRTLALCALALFSSFGGGWGEVVAQVSRTLSSPRSQRGIEYANNANGAMTKDLNKRISNNIEYNLLNLPLTVDILSPAAEARNPYSYSVDGVKLRVVKKYNSNFNTSPVIRSAVDVSSMNVTKTTDYVENKLFENNALDRILVDGGYTKDGVYHFYETNHLGDYRTVINQSETITGRNDYYPFEIQMANNASNLGILVRIGDKPNAFKFSGKELDVMGGLNLYDFSARSQDPTLGRFTTVDPLAEKEP